MHRAAATQTHRHCGTREAIAVARLCREIAGLTAATTVRHHIITKSLGADSRCTHENPLAFPWRLDRGGFPPCVWLLLVRRAVRAGVCVAPSMSGKEADDDTHGDIVAKVQRYLFEEDDFESTFMKWGQDHCDIIDVESEEMKLECVVQDVPCYCCTSVVQVAHSSPAPAAGTRICTTSFLSSSRPRLKPLLQRCGSITLHTVCAVTHGWLSCAWYMQNGSDVRTFYRILKERSIADPDGDDSMFIQIMLAVVEFDVFMQMMKEAKIAKDAQASHK